MLGPEAQIRGPTSLCPLACRDYASWNLSVNLYTVNAPWLFSLLWCAGVPSVTSDNSHTLSQVSSPLWIMVSWGIVGGRELLWPVPATPQAPRSVRSQAGGAQGGGTGFSIQRVCTASGGCTKVLVGGANLGLTHREENITYGPWRS